MTPDPEPAADTAPGWFGKLPCLGDFASRRLRSEHRDAWDAWLSGTIVAARERWGTTWLDLYLRAPVWFWLQAPGEHQRHWSAGTLMPSVDQAGRYFPLVIVQPLRNAPQDVEDWQRLQHTLDRLAAASLAMLAASSSVAGFEDALAASATLHTASSPAASSPRAPPAPGGSSAGLPVSTLQAASATPGPPIASWLLARCACQLVSSSLWWGAHGVSPRIEARWPQDGHFLWGG